VFGPSLLKEVGSELGAGYLRGDRQDRNAAALAIMESINEMEIARPTASCADRKFACNLRFASGREGGDLFVADHHPVDAIVSADGVGKAVERVAGDSIDTLHSSSHECLDDYIGDLDQHFLSEHLRLDAILRFNGLAPRAPANYLGRPHHASDATACYSAYVISNKPRPQTETGWDSRRKCRRPDLDMVKQSPLDGGIEERRGQSSWHTACAIGGK
jgi:hypothetical protein